MEEVLDDRRVCPGLVGEDVDPVNSVDRLRDAVERPSVGRQKGVSAERVMPVPLVVMAAVVMTAVVRMAMVMAAASR
jgi:hypothetical protein